MVTAILNSQQESKVGEALSSSSVHKSIELSQDILYMAPNYKQAWN